MCWRHYLLRRTIDLFETWCILINWTVLLKYVTTLLLLLWRHAAIAQVSNSPRTNVYWLLNLNVLLPLMVLMVSKMNCFVGAECSLSFDANPVCVLLSVSAQQFVTRTIVWPAPIRSSTATWLICKHTIVHIISIAYYVCSISAICVRTEKMTFKRSEHSFLSKPLSKREQLMIWFSVPFTVVHGFFNFKYIMVAFAWNQINLVVQPWMWAQSLL